MRALASASWVVALSAFASVAYAETPAGASAAPPVASGLDAAPAGTAVPPSTPEPNSPATATGAAATPPAKDARPAAATPPLPVSAVTPLPVSMAAPASDAESPRPLKGPLESRFNVRVDFDTVWYTKPSFDFFSDRDASVFFGASLGYTLFRFDLLSVIPELGFNGNHAGASELFGGAISRTSLTSENAYAGVSARWELLSILDLAGRLSGGASFVQFEMQPNGANATLLADDGVAPFMALGAGFTVHTQAGAFETRGGSLRSLVAGLSVESGYIFGGSMRLTPTPSASTGRVDTGYMSLGNLERSGPYLQISLTARF